MSLLVQTYAELKGQSSCFTSVNVGGAPNHQIGVAMGTVEVCFFFFLCFFVAFF